MLGVETMGHALQLFEFHGVDSTFVDAQLVQTQLAVCWQKITSRRIEQTPDFVLFFELLHQAVGKFYFGAGNCFPFG